MTLGTTVDDLVTRVRRDAQMTLRPTYATLASSYTAGGASLVLNEDIDIGAGSILAVDVELFYVTSASGSTVNVIGGFEGTTPANHDADSFVEVDPRLPKASLVDFAQNEVTSWASQLFHVDQVDVPVSNAELTYNLDTGSDTVLFFLEVRGTPSATTLLDRHSYVKARLLRDVPTSTFAAGQAIQLYTYPSASSLRVVYATPFDLSPFTLTTDLVTSCHLTPGQVDVLEAGVRWRMLTAGLAPRTNWAAAGMSRDAEEVTVIDVMRASDMARAIRDRLLTEQALELTRQWPFREQ